MGKRLRALVLSGGGGRGAYHVGVAQALVETGWMADGQGPDILSGTSIGAMNCAALASGLTVEQLRQRWLDLRTEHVHRLSDDIPGILKPALNALLRGELVSKETREHGGAVPKPAESPHEGLLQRAHEFLAGRPFRSLLDNAPWRQALASWFDFERINSPAAPALVVYATGVRTGAMHTFCNRDRPGVPRTQVTMDHILASASIPAVYPMTRIGERLLWDGAVGANTPFARVLDLADGAELEIVVVLLSPWHPDPDVAEAQATRLPEPTGLLHLLNLSLDWSLLASLRAVFKMIQRARVLGKAIAHLREAGTLSEEELAQLDESPGVLARDPIVIAPEQLMPMEWIITYEPENHRRLFEMGRQDALRALAAAGVA